MNGSRSMELRSIELSIELSMELSMELNIELRSMVSALDFRTRGPGSSPGRGHSVMCLRKTLNSHHASLHPYT